MQEPITILGFVVGGTQIVKDLGFVSGNWLKAVAVILGGVATYLTVYEPMLWEQLTGLIVAIGGTGGVSYIKSLLGK